MKWWRVVLAGAGVLVVAASYRDIGNVLGIWFSGRSASGSVLWGLPVVWWGRIGKFLQFAAGLAVVLDLVGPDRLRRRGEKASTHVQDYKDWRARARRRQELTQFVLRIKERIVRMTGPLTYELVTEPAQPLPDQPWIAEPMIDRLRSTIVDDLVRQYDLLGPPVELGDLQANFAHQRIDEFVREALPHPERELLDREDDPSWKIANRIACSLIVATGLILVGIWTYVMFKYMYYDDGENSFFLVLVLGSFAILIGTVFGVAHQSERTPVHVMVGSVVLASTARLVAKVLDHSAPGHQLRWFAFYLFLTGFGLDLLAS